MKRALLRFAAGAVLGTGCGFLSDAVLNSIGHRDLAISIAVGSLVALTVWFWRRSADFADGLDFFDID